jgi:hypothetical protein
MKRERPKNTQTGSYSSSTFSTLETGSLSNRIRIEELKSFPGFENIEDKEAEEIIQSLYKLSLLTYEVLNK